MTRLYGEKEDINKENLDKRQEEESKIVFENIDLTEKKIIEIGCGLGRWAEVFHDKCESYLGLDYAENLIKIAKEYYNYDNCEFQVMSALDMNTEELLINPPFDIIFVAGVLIYLNDEDISQMIKEINKIASKDKTIYIRETVSVMDTRLTLKDFYSEDLDADYNAIYRTEDELLEFFKGFENITHIKSDKIHETLNKHEETGYRYFILE